MMCNLYFLAFLSISGLVIGQVDLDDLSKQSNNLGGPDLNDLQTKLEGSGINVPNINVTKFNADKVEQVLREKCEKQGAGDAVDTIKNEKDLIQQCFTQQINATQIQEELDEAKKTGSMDVVFAKYCKKWPDIYSCIENVTSTVRRCLTDSEEKAFNKTLSIVSELQEFMCFKDGDRLAMFVAEGGVECVQGQQTGIQDCLNATLNGRIPNIEDMSVNSLPLLAFTQENCEDFDKIRECVNDVLEKCKDTTPANIVDAFFKFLKKQMPCEATAVRLAADTKPSSAASNMFSSAIWILIVMLLMKLY